MGSGGVGVAALTPNWLGDVVMALPALGALARELLGRGGSRRLDVWTPRPFAPLLDALLDGAEVLPFDLGASGLARLRGRFRLARAMRARGYGSIALLPFSHGLARWTPEAALEEKKWKAYKKFISDFSAMKDAGPSLLPMWEEHLVYATALGVADKLLSNLKMVAEEYRQGVPAAAWYYPRGGGMPGEGFTSLDSFSSSFSNLQNLSSALSSSTIGTLS